MRHARSGRILIARALRTPFAGAALLCAAPSLAQETPDTPAVQDADPQEEPAAIVVVAERGSAATNIAPIAVLDADTVAATGAASMPELLRAIRGLTQSADGSEPIFLLNAQRVSGYQDIGSLPPEAIAKVEVLPEPAAIKFGFPPTRRVVNFITKRPFRQIEARTSAGTTTRVGAATETAHLGLTRLQGDSRLTLALEYRHTDALFQSDRDITPDPDVPFDAIGNVGGVNVEIDPALSAIVGHVVRIARVPEAEGQRSTLAGYAAGADNPRAFALGDLATLAPRNQTLKAEGVFARPVTDTVAGSISFSAEQSRDSAVNGPASATLLVPEDNPASPFSGPVLLYRYLTETGLLTQDYTTTTLQGGALLRGAISGWRWDLTAEVRQVQVDGRIERGIDLSAANAAIAAGANPFAPLDAALLRDRLVDRSRQRTRTIEAKTVVTKDPFRLPGGRVNVTATVEIGRAASASSTRGNNPFDLQLARTRGEGGVALSLPLASKREGFLPFLGELSLDATVRARSVSGFGSLHDSTWGLNWSPVERIQLIGTIKRSAAAPDMAQQSTPALEIPEYPVFDYSTGRTEIATLLLGGNPDLAAERRLTRSLTLTVKPFSAKEVRFSATYETTAIRDQTGTIRAITPQIEAILPGLVVRDSGGRLVSVSNRPVNFSLERQRTLNFTVNTFGKLGPKPPPPAPGSTAKPPAQINYYAGMGPSIRFRDRLQLRPGTPELDLLDGDTTGGWLPGRAFGYAYGGINYLGTGLTFDAWYNSGHRVRSANPRADLHYGSLFKLNLGGSISVHHYLSDQEWTRHLQVKVDVSNVTNGRQRVRDGNGDVPTPFQRDYQDPVGRTVTLTLRKLF